MEMTEEQLAERKVKIDAFLGEYRELVLKHLLDFRCRLAVEPTGIAPRMEIFDVVLEDKKE